MALGPDAIPDVLAHDRVLRCREVQDGTFPRDMLIYIQHCLSESGQTLPDNVPVATITQIYSLFIAMGYTPEKTTELLQSWQMFINSCGQYGHALVARMARAISSGDVPPLACSLLPDGIDGKYFSATRIDGTPTPYECVVFKTQPNLLPTLFHEISHAHDQRLIGAFGQAVFLRSLLGGGITPLAKIFRENPNDFRSAFTESRSCMADQLTDLQNPLLVALVGRNPKLKADLSAHMANHLQTKYPAYYNAVLCMGLQKRFLTLTGIEDTEKEIIEFIQATRGAHLPPSFAT